MLLNIIICEDDETLRTYYQLIIKKYIKKHPEIEMKIIVSTGNPREVDIYMDHHNDDIKLFLLDIEFPDSKIKGIDLAINIRKKDTNAKIIFITTHEELTPMIFDRKVEPLDYIPKEIGITKIQKKLYQDLDIAIDCLDLTNKNSESIFEFGPKPYAIPKNQINYFDSSEYANSISLHTDSGIIEFHGTLKSIESILPTFYRAHKSLLVNPDNIIDIDNKNSKLIFKNGSSCDISRRKLAILKKYINK